MENNGEGASSSIYEGGKLKVNQWSECSENCDCQASFREWTVTQKILSELSEGNDCKGHVMEGKLVRRGTHGKSSYASSKFELLPLVDSWMHSHKCIQRGLSTEVIIGSCSDKPLKT